MMIYTDLFNVPSKEVYYTILYHDVPEIVTGDIPFLAKRIYPQLKQILYHIELDHIPSRLNFKLPEITKEENDQIKIADLTEMLLFAVDDVNMGCQYSIDVMENILEVLSGDTKVRVYLEITGYQRAIDRILATRERQDTRPIPGTCELHSESSGYSNEHTQLGRFNKQPEGSYSYDLPQTGPSTNRRPKSS
jgi:hypothetical protein